MRSKSNCLRNQVESQITFKIRSNLIHKSRSEIIKAALAIQFHRTVTSTMCKASMQLLTSGFFFCYILSNLSIISRFHMIERLQNLPLYFVYTKEVNLEDMENDQSLLSAWCHRTLENNLSSTVVGCEVKVALALSFSFNLVCVCVFVMTKMHKNTRSLVCLLIMRQFVCLLACLLKNIFIKLD